MTEPRLCVVYHPLDSHETYVAYRPSTIQLMDDIIIMNISCTMTLLILILPANGRYGPFVKQCADCHSVLNLFGVSNSK